MTLTPYTFCAIRYVHDPTAGEMLNIGVILYAPKAHYLGFRLESVYGRLSSTFAHFNGEDFLRYARHIENALQKMAVEVQPHLEIFASPQSLEAIGRVIFPDQGGCFVLGPIHAGITKDPIAETTHLFERLVSSQYERESKPRRNDDQVWKAYQAYIPQEVKFQFREKSFETPEFEAKFPYTFKNGKYHVIQPVSLDYAHDMDIQKRATSWLGNGLALEGHPELAQLYLLLGAPQNEQHLQKYQRAKDLMHKMPIKHEIIEENEAADFAAALESYMREHNILPEKPTKEPV